MAPAATRISVTFESSLKDYGHDKTFVVGGVVRSSMEQGSAEVARKAFKLSKGKPTLLVLGGGTGAVQINNALSVMGKELEKRMNVIHLTGIGKLEKKLTSITNKGESLGYVNDDVRTLLMLGLPFLLASIALVLNVRVEKLMLGVLATPEDIEVFQIAWLAFIAGYAPILSVRAVMLSWFGETRHDVDILQHRQQRALKIIFIATVPGLIIGYTLGQASIGWVFPNYANDAKPIFLLLLIAWALALNASVPITMIQVSEKPMYYAAVLWFGIIVDTIFCILMIPEQGTEGAAIGAIVGAASVLISAMILNRKLYLNTTGI